MGDPAHRPVPGLPVGWFSQCPIALLSGPSITTYTPTVKVQVLKSTIYEMASSVRVLKGMTAEVFNVCRPLLQVLGC